MKLNGINNEINVSDKAALNSARESVQIDAYCKINISLDIEGLRSDGYHDVEMILQTIPLCDHVTIKKGLPIKKNANASDKVVLLSNEDWVPTDEKNTAVKAALLLKENFREINTSTEIYIDKRIPRCGGLGGSSADAAAVLAGMNRLYGLGLKYEQLCEFAAKIGSDVPFLLKSGAAVATQTGTKLRYIEPFSGGILLLVNPNIDVSTPEAYRVYDTLQIPDSAHPNTSEIVQAMCGAPEQLGPVIKNVLEFAAFKIYPQLETLKNELISTKPAAVMMSGSGATFYAIYSKEHIKRAVGTARYYSSKGYFTYITPI